MKYAILLSLVFSGSGAFAVDCKTLASNQEIYACLNEYAKSSLAKDSPADQAFTARLNRLLAKYDLTSAQVKTQSLAESFSIFVDQRSPKKDADQSQPCFDFTKTWTRAGAAQNVELVQRQIDQAALFLADLHAASWGHQVSLLFPIKEVSICSKSLLHDRAVSFEQRSLFIGLSSSVVPAHELTEAWNSGHPIRSTELSWYDSIPFLGEKLRLLGQRKNPEGILRDKLADNWMVLNPTGTLRTTALYTLAEAIFKLRAGLETLNGTKLETRQMYNAMVDVVRGPGFTKADQDRLDRLGQDPLALAALYNLWQQKIYSPQNILTVIENAIGDQSRRNTNLHLTLRKINAGVSVANDKNIIVRLEQLMQNAIPVSNFADNSSANGVTIEFTRTVTKTNPDGSGTTKSSTIRAQGVDAQDVTVNGDEVNAGVSVNLIDNVVVSVQIPNISPATYRRVSLYQALSEIVPPGEVSRP